MKSLLIAGALGALSLSTSAFAQALPPMTLKVDATDTDRAIFRVEQHIPVAKPGPMTLLLPEWLPGTHAPRGQIEKIVGLVIKADGKVIPWKRDPLDVFSFSVDVPQGAQALDVSFQFVSATESDQGRIVVTDAMMNVQWQSVSLYPGGIPTRNIPVSATITYPAGWQAATALRPASKSGDTVTYQTVDYETLVDSPVFAGKYFKAVDLGQNVTLNMVADQPKNLEYTPEQMAKHKKLVEQAIKTFGTRQFDHYDFLLALTDKMGGIGLEHHRSSENSVNPEYFSEWDPGPGRRNLLPHEFSHSWDGKHRRPAGQAVPDFKTPLVSDLLWVYEGQDQFWGYVLGARSGLFAKEQTLDAYASIAANLDLYRARDWRPMVDTTNDPVMSARKPKAWTTWQRSEDYYNEGLLIWMEVNAIMREQSAGKKGLDDFARAFFGTKEGDWSANPYDFKQLVSVLNSVVPYDWASFLDERVNRTNNRAPLNGFTKSGYTLTYTDEPTGFFKDNEKTGKITNLNYSLGLTVNKDAKITAVVWDGPAFNAGLTVGTTIIGVGDRTYSDTGLKDAIKAAKGGDQPIKLLVKNGDRLREVAIQWNGGLRYPRFEKTGKGEGWLDKLLQPLP